MTTVVLTSEKILADCRVSLTIKVKDEEGVERKVTGNTDEYSKIGYTGLVDSDDNPIGSYVIFGDVEVAKQIHEFVEATGMQRMDKCFEAISKFKIEWPKVQSGFAWVSSEGQIWTLSVSRDGWAITRSDAEVLCLGTGKQLFELAYAQTGDLMAAFIHALSKDEQSSTLVYDQWLRADGITARHKIPEHFPLMTLDQLIGQKA